MIGDLLTAIKDAENDACSVIEQAHVKAEKIRTDANAEIEKINAALEDDTAKLLVKTYKPANEKAEPEPVIIEVSKDKTDAAIKFIVSEFSKRFPK